MAKKIQRPPGEVLLDRKYLPEEIRKDLGEPISYLEELADYGVQLLKRSLLTGERGIPEVILLPVLFRQIMSFLDAVHLHLLNGAVYTAIPDLRAMELDGSPTAPWNTKWTTPMNQGGGTATIEAAVGTWDVLSPSIRQVGS